MRELLLEIADEHVGQIVCEPSSNHHSQGAEVCPILWKSVARYLPSTFAQSVRNVEYREVINAIGKPECEHWQFVTIGNELERFQFLDFARQTSGDIRA